MEVLASNMTKINVLGKRDIKEANAVLSLWERVQLDGRIYRLAKKFREKIEIPNDGFDSSNKFETWHKQIKIKGKELERITNTNQFIEKSKQLFPYQGIMREVHFRLLMLSFLYYNEVDSEDLNKCSKKEIEKYFQVKADYKYMAIVSLMKEAGYAGVTDEIVRAVIQRRKIKM